MGLLKSGRAASFSLVVREQTWSQTMAEGASVLTSSPGNHFITAFLPCQPLANVNPGARQPKGGLGGGSIHLSVLVPP